MRPESTFPERHEDGGVERRLVATFARRERAEAAVRELEGAGVGRDRIAVEGRVDEVIALRGEEHQQVENSWAAPAVGLTTPGQTRGSLVWTIVGAVVGAVIGLLLAFIPIGGFSFGARLVVAAIVGAVAGGTVGLIAGGGVGPGRSGEMRPPAAQRGTTVGVRVEDPNDTDRVKRLLQQHGPERVDEVGPLGEPRLGGVRPGETT